MIQAVDFIYDNISLSSFGFMVCNFGSDADYESADSTRKFNDTNMFYGNYMPFTVSAYNDHLEFEMSIMKYNCENRNDYVITLNEARYLKRWLNRPEEHKFKIIYKEYSYVYYEGSFNVEDVFIGGNRVGFNLTFTTNRPFGIHEPVTYKQDMDSVNDVLRIVDISDEIGYIYPDMVVTVKEAGDLLLFNSFENPLVINDNSNGNVTCTIIKNCLAGEVLHFYPTMFIDSNISTHKLYNDFNYHFLKISNDMHNRSNNIQASLKCNISITYSPIVKAVI